jgi:RimJ/RimL family protein N-acetyltransferase
MIKSVDTARGIVVIREASLADAIQFRDLRLNALQDSPTAFSADYQTNLNHPMEYWHDRLREDKDAVIFFAEHDHHLIGMTGIARGRSPKTRHSAGIWGVYLRPEWRGLRIAEALIETCCEWGKTQQMEIVKLGVVTTNAPAIRCYERCGFTTYGTEPRGIFYEGKYYDEYLMFKMLDGS